jgi:release factor glutamine methyltransferase
VQSILRKIFFHALSRFYSKDIREGGTVEVLDFVLDVPPTVFHPRLYFTSVYFGQYLASLDLKGKRVLDMGCGSGLLAIVAASQGAMVNAVDINPLAVAATRSNASAIGVESNFRVLQGDLFEALDGDEVFDLILFNPPYYAKEPLNDRERAFFGGEDYRVLREFAGLAGSHLANNGSIALILTTDVDEHRILSFFDAQIWESTVVMSRKALFERLTIYELRMKK